MPRFFVLIIIILLYSCSSSRTSMIDGINPYQYNILKAVTGQKGTVVSAHPLASKVGVGIMKKGGNAIDAAIATQLALAVVYPGAGNIGGGGFLVAHLATGKQIALDFREKAPASAHRNMYLDAAGNVNFDKSQNGHLASGVPGTVAGLFESLQYARLPFRQLIQPAIELAEKGFVITEREAVSLNLIQEELNHYNTVRNIFQRNSPWTKGDTLIQKELASTLKRISDFGIAGFYQGKTAQLIVDEMKRGGGIITKEDLLGYQAIWRAPYSFKYKDHTIISMPMPSSGGVMLHQMMKMIEDKPLRSYGFLSPMAVQLMVEAERRAFADRAKYMGDPDFFRVPVQQLTSDNYLKERMKDFVAGIAGKSDVIKAGVIQESSQTTHISILDAEGNAVSVTTTLNNTYGSKTVVGGAGFFLNDEMDDFSAKPGVANLYGAVGGEANAIQPGKRMLSSMTPTIVLKKGKPYIVTGTPGGTTIPTSVFQTLVNIIDFNLSTDDTVNKPKFHHQWLPDVISIERQFPHEVSSALTKMGYTLQTKETIGRVETIQVLPDGRYEAVADNRGDDAAEGY